VWVNRVIPMDDEDDEGIDFDVIDAAIRTVGGLEPSDEDSSCIAFG